VLFYILVREDRVFGIISVAMLIFINVVLFWQISALDLESINVKFLFYMLDLFFLVFVNYFCYDWGGLSYFVGA